jgi:formamidopyrimidine-DNA glycosylase
MGAKIAEGSDLRYLGWMPELPEVETVRRGLAGVLVGKRIARLDQRRADLRIPLPDNFAARVEGRRVVALERRAKYMLARLDDEQVWLIHLGMSGRMGILPAGHNHPPAGPHDHVIFETEDGVMVRFTDARRFGLMTLCPAAELPQHPLIQGLGPEPLAEDFTGARLAAALKGKKTPIKSAILDQRVVAGIGNIYACESLYYAGISPRRSAHTVQGARADRLVAAIKEVLTAAIAAGGSSLRDHVQPSGELGYFQHSFAVYDREGQACRRCESQMGTDILVRRMVQAGRSTFYCASHQR